MRAVQHTAAFGYATARLEDPTAPPPPPLLPPPDGPAPAAKRLAIADATTNATALATTNASTDVTALTTADVTALATAGGTGDWDAHAKRLALLALPAPSAPYSIAAAAAAAVSGGTGPACAAGGEVAPGGGADRGDAWREGVAPHRVASAVAAGSW